jgi:hypothetical protein
MTKDNRLPKEIIARIEKDFAPGPEELDPKNAIKVVIIIEGFAPNANCAWPEMVEIAQGYGMKICDIIIETCKLGDEQND